MEFISYDRYVFFDRANKTEIDQEWTSCPRYLLDEILEKLFRVLADEEKDDYKIIIDNNNNIKKKFIKTGKYKVYEYDNDKKISDYSVKTWRDRSDIRDRIIKITRIAKTRLDTIELDKENKVFKMCFTDVKMSEVDSYEV